MSVVALAGDWHGNTAWAQARIAEVASNGVALILHLGDFGIWPGPSGRRYLDDLEATCAEYGVGIWVTPGNHEDWQRLTELWADPLRTGRPLRVTPHIAVLPRGYRFELEGRSFVSLGGAPSVDRYDRVPGRDWWPEEMISEDEARGVAVGGYADVMLTHDAPLAPFEVPRVAYLRLSNEYGWPARALAYAQVGAERLHRAFLGVRPRLLVHGHFHVAGEMTGRIPGADYDTRIVSLDCDGADGNIAYLNLATLELAGDVVRTLRETLGAKLVAYLAEAPDTALVEQWAKGEGTPSAAVLARLHAASEAALVLLRRDDVSTVQAWFQGENPALDAVSPARLLREGGDGAAQAVLDASRQAAEQ